MPAMNLKQFLNEQRVPFQVIPHPVAFTATSVAGAAHIPGREMAKTVVVELDGHLALAVLPANRKLDLERLRQGTGALEAKLA